MKRVNEILKSTHQPYLKNIIKYRCFNKILMLLPPRFQKAIAFFYIKNNILFGALKHPGFKMELNYNKDLVKALLKEIAKIDSDCKELFQSIKKIEFFVSKVHIPKNISLNEQTIPFYKELSKGEFEIKAKDKDLAKIFEKIKKAIKNNNENN